MGKRINNEELTQQAFKYGDIVKTDEGVGTITSVSYGINQGFKYFIFIDSPEGQLIRYQEQKQLLKTNKPTQTKDCPLMKYMGDTVYFIFDRNRINRFVLDSFTSNKKSYYMGYRAFTPKTLLDELKVFNADIKSSIDEVSNKLAKNVKENKILSKSMGELSNLDLSALNISDHLLKSIVGLGSYFGDNIAFNTMDNARYKGELKQLLKGYRSNKKLIEKLKGHKK